MATAADDQRKLLRVDGFVLVDGRVIYAMKDFTVCQTRGGYVGGARSGQLRKLARMVEQSAERARVVEVYAWLQAAAVERGKSH